MYAVPRVLLWVGSYEVRWCHPKCVGVFRLLRRALTSRFPVGQGERCCREWEAEAGASLLIVFIELGGWSFVAAHRGFCSSSWMSHRGEAALVCNTLVCVPKHW